MKRQFEFTHCKGRNIVYSVQLLCKFSQYYQIKWYGNFNTITAGVAWRLKLNATSVDLTILTTMQWAISQYEWEYNNIMLCMESNVAT
jgi:hypothetical protein